MLSKQTAKRLNVLLSEDANKELNMVLDEMIEADKNKLSGSSTDRDLLAIAARIELMKRLKNLKTYAQDRLKDPD